MGLFTLVKLVRVQIHHHHVRLCHLKKSAVAELNINLGHHIQLNDMSILAKKFRHMGRIIREVVEIEFQPDNMTEVMGFA